MRLLGIGTLAQKVLIQVFVRDGGEPESFFWHFFVNSFGASSAVPGRVRTALYKMFGMRVDWSSLVKPGCIVRTRRLSIGRFSTVNYGCIFDNRVGVQIGDNSGVGIGVKFLNTDHEIVDPECRAGVGKSSGIVVGNGVFIGSNAVLMPGVTVGDGAVIGASALVTADCEAHGLYLGVPAKLVRVLPREPLATAQ